MTCIVAVRDEVRGRVVMGGDAAGVAGLDIRKYRNPKVFKNGPFVMGYTSSFRMGQLLEHSFIPSALPKPDEDMYRYMVRTFIEDVRILLKDRGYTTIENNQEEGGTFIVAVGAHLFDVHDDFQVAEYYEPFSAVGCGQSYALGALRQLENEGIMYSPEDKVRKALRVASQLSAGVCEPFTVISTDAADATLVNGQQHAAAEGGES